MCWINELSTNIYFLICNLKLNSYLPLRGRVLVTHSTNVRRRFDIDSYVAIGATFAETPIWRSYGDGRSRGKTRFPEDVDTAEIVENEVHPHEHRLTVRFVPLPSL